MEGKPIWIWAAAGVLVLLIGVNVLRGPLSGSSSGQSAQAPAGAIAISIANSSTKQDWLHESVKEFNTASARDSKLQSNGKPIFVEILQETIDGRKVDYRSGAMVADTLSGKIKPTIVSPGEETWVQKLQSEWQALHRARVPREVGPQLVRTPLVVGAWRSRAEALGCWPTPEPRCTWQSIRDLAASEDGWGSIGHPEWGKFKLGYGYVGEANSGTLGATLMCMAGDGVGGGLQLERVDVSSACGTFIADVEKAKVHSGTSANWLIDQMSQGGPEYLDAVIVWEADVIGANRARGSELREPIVSIYPQDGTFVVGHPFTILEGAQWVAEEQVAAARVFRDYLLGADRQRAVMAAGLRPADSSIRLVPPIDTSNGANPEAKVTSLDVPEGPVIDRIVEVWHRVRKHAVVAIVFDKSGSMAGQKITAAVKGAQEFVRVMDRDDRLVWMPFDSRVYPAVDGAGSEVGEQLITAIGSTPASGGTALYDAILAAQGRLDEVRAERGDSVRYGIVVLSDGRDQNSQRSLSQLEAALRPHEADPTGIQIHTIAIGTDADENVLKKIAFAAHGRYWKGQTAEDVAKVYKAIATYY